MRGIAWTTTRGARVDGSARRIGARRAGTTAGGDDLLSVCQFCLRRGKQPLQKLLELRSPLARASGVRRRLGPRHLALGCCIGRSKRRTLQAWGGRLFERALALVEKSSSPRAWAFALIGIHEYFRRLSGDRLVNQLRETLTERLTDLYAQTAADDWHWFEPKATYDNAKLPHALILSGRWSNSPRALEIGLKSLRWLAEQQRAAAGHFRPIGCKGFFPHGQEPAHYDQQPIEAQAMLSASIEAYRATQDPYWLEQARTSFEWFTGRNDLGAPLYDAGTGGCRDGLHADRVNENQGAESTLCFLLALAEMQLLEEVLATVHNEDVHGELPAAPARAVLHLPPSEEMEFFSGREADGSSSQTQ